MGSRPHRCGLGANFAQAVLVRLAFWSGSLRERVARRQLRKPSQPFSDLFTSSLHLTFEIERLFYQAAPRVRSSIVEDSPMSEWLFFRLALFVLMMSAVFGVALIARIREQQRMGRSRRIRGVKLQRQVHSKPAPAPSSPVTGSAHAEVVA